MQQKAENEKKKEESKARFMHEKMSKKLGIMKRYQIKTVRNSVKNN
jgi:hypothetical protein